MVNKFFDVRIVNLQDEIDEKYFNKVVKNAIYKSVNDVVIFICGYAFLYYLFAIISDSGVI
jgi:Fe2+ transport system protein B